MALIINSYVGEFGRLWCSSIPFTPRLVGAVLNGELARGDGAKMWIMWSVPLLELWIFF